MSHILGKMEKTVYDSIELHRLVGNLKTYKLLTSENVQSLCYNEPHVAKTQKVKPQSTPVDAIKFQIKLEEEPPLRRAVYSYTLH